MRSLAIPYVEARMETMYVLGV